MRPQREARLRPEFADQYPYLTPGVWESEALLTDRVIASLLSRPEGFTWAKRALNPAHFEFRASEEASGRR
jgi:hypothetical protein